MRLSHVFHQALGDEFARMRPDLAAVPLPVLRVALRSLRRHIDPPNTPVIAHVHEGTPMVWTLEPTVPTLVRPARWLGQPATHVELDTDTGTYRVAVLTADQALVASRNVCPPARPTTAPTTAPAADLARRLQGLHLHLDQLTHQPMHHLRATQLLAALTVCAQLYPSLLAGLADLATGYQDHPGLSALDVPGIADPYGGGTAGLTAAALLRQAAGQASHIPALLDDAHQQLDRLHTRPATSNPAAGRVAWPGGRPSDSGPSPSHDVR